MPRLPRLTTNRAVILIAAAVVGYFLFNAVGDTLLSQHLNQDEQQLKLEVANLQDAQAKLQAIRDYLQTDEYVEGVARRVLGLVRPGESLVNVNSTAPATATPVAVPDGGPALPWWEQLYGP